MLRIRTLAMPSPQLWSILQVLVLVLLFFLCMRNFGLAVMNGHVCHL